MYKIYKLTSPNRKSYIGLTKHSVDQRLSRHLQANTYIGNALRKYGRENFKIEILVDNIETGIEAYDIEGFYIQWYGTFSNGYNQTLGHEMGSTLKKHPSSIEKQKETWKNKTPEEIREKERKRWEKMRDPEKYDEWIHKMSEVTKGSNNGNAKHIQIFDQDDHLIHDCVGTFNQLMKDSELPKTELLKSLYSGGTPLYSKTKRKVMYKYRKYIGWYAKYGE